MILLPTNSHIALLVVLQQGGKHSNQKEFIMRTAVACNSCLQPLVTALHILVVYVLDGTLYQTSWSRPNYCTIVRVRNYKVDAN